jgi:hypothetical protein
VRMLEGFIDVFKHIFVFGTEFLWDKDGHNVFVLDLDKVVMVYILCLLTHVLLGFCLVFHWEICVKGVGFKFMLKKDAFDG